MNLPLEILGIVLEYYSTNVKALSQLLELRLVSQKFDEALTWSTNLTSELVAYTDLSRAEAPQFLLAFKTSVGLTSEYVLDAAELESFGMNGLEFWIDQGRLANVSLMRSTESVRVDEETLVFVLDFLFKFLQDKTDVKSFETLTLFPKLRVDRESSGLVVQKINESSLEFSANLMFAPVRSAWDSNEGSVEKLVLGPKINRVLFQLSRSRENLPFDWFQLDHKDTKIEQLGIKGASINASTLYHVVSLTEPHLKSLFLESTSINYDGESLQELVPPWLHEMELDSSSVNYNGNNEVDTPKISCSVEKLKVMTDEESLPIRYTNNLDYPGELSYLKNIVFSRLKDLTLTLTFSLENTMIISHMLSNVERLRVNFTKWEMLDVFETEAFQRSPVKHLEIFNIAGGIYVPHKVISSILKLHNLKTINLEFGIVEGEPKEHDTERLELATAFRLAVPGERGLSFTKNKCDGFLISIE